MKKITTLLTAGLFTVLSASAFACPKGTTLVGGTGPNHKGGKCVVANPAAQTASKASTTATKAKADTTKAVEAKPKDAKAAVKTETAATKAKAETATKVKTDAAAKAKAETAAKVAMTKDKAVKTASTNPLKP
ncbi:hypothetical protein RFY44_17505 [Acinetobacter bereziniae]|uniref:hypothetical protein n=1 Tax=Acinetobacter bereziniae TaxID=106648 RepID=UPI002812FC0C|nr:hypothetical protein [Acinetobacter bereziniae]MDQ9820651.1 hypothetical protein [Acinetobacter bereziniae]